MVSNIRPKVLLAAVSGFGRMSILVLVALMGKLTIIYIYYLVHLLDRSSRLTREPLTEPRKCTTTLLRIGWSFLRLGISIVVIVFRGEDTS